jgi:hypothetical protein
MSAAYLSGISYESRIAARLASLRWSESRVPVRLVRPPAGATHGNDVQFYAAPYPTTAPLRVIGLEIKTAGAVEAGQRTFKLTKNGDLALPDNQQNQIHRYCLPAGFRPFKGRVPSFLLGDKSFATWREEKRHFTSEYLNISEPDMIARYYRSKGSDYIQIQDLGLYHTGADPCAFGVPLFTCNIRIRIRCKQHGSSSLPTSVLAALEIRDRSQIPASPYCLEHRVPSVFMEAAASSPDSSSASASSSASYRRSAKSACSESSSESVSGTGRRSQDPQETPLLLPPPLQFRQSHIERYLLPLGEE